MPLLTSDNSSMLNWKGTMPPSLVRRWCALPGDARAFLRRAIDRLGLSPRAYERIVRIARTIADLDGSRDIALPHVAEAVAYRTLDRPLVPWDRPPDPAAGGME